MENKIKSLVLKVGIDPALKGYDYLVEAVRLCYEDKSYIHSITKTLYPSVAKKFNTTPSRVERAMRHAVSSSSANNPDGFEFLGFVGSYERGSLTNSQFIATCVEYLKIHE